MTPVSAELIDDQSLLLIVPAEDKLAKADAAAGRALGAGDVASVVDRDDEEYLAPIHRAGEEDRNIERAVAAAQQCLGEVLEAWAAPRGSVSPVSQGGLC